MSSSGMVNSVGFVVFCAGAFLDRAPAAVLRAGAEVRFRVVLADFLAAEPAEVGTVRLLWPPSAEFSSGVASVGDFELFAIYFCFWWAKPLPEERASASGIRHESGFQTSANLTMRHFLFRWAITTVAVMVAAFMINGIRYDSVASLVGAALLLGILNAFLRPILLILMAPLIILTLGLFIFVVNGFLLLIVNDLVHGFHVDHFGSAFWGAILISIVSWGLSAFFRGSDGQVHPITHHPQIRQVKGRVVGSSKPGEL